MKTIAITAALLLCASAAFAKDEGGDPMAACKGDFERYCKSVQPGEGRIMQCMMDNKSSVSAPCKAVLDKKQQDPMAACNSDFQRYCKSVQPGEGRIMKCMMENKTRVSAPCSAVLEKKQQEEQQYSANKQKTKPQ
jgi:hypothetical protein